MLNLITSSVSDSLAIPQWRDRSCPVYKVVSSRIRKARKGYLRKAGKVVVKA
jgi:hypothetical protein